MTDAATLTPEQRRELMPLCAKFLDEMRKELPIEFIRFEENGYFYEWERK